MDESEELMDTRRGFGELELAILTCLRGRGEVSVREVQQHLGGQDRYTTVMTVMSRLAEKGKLERSKRGRQYLYRLPAQGSRAEKGFFQSIKERVFGGRSASMIAYLLESSEDISAQDLDELQALIDEEKQRRGGE